MSGQTANHLCFLQHWRVLLTMSSETFDCAFSTGVSDSFGGGGGLTDSMTQTTTHCTVLTVT